ncbi:MAG: helix-turn-helix transcriptional regulator [Spirochaetota bacterium]
MELNKKFHKLFIPIAFSFLVLTLVVSGFFIFYINKQLVSFIYTSEIHNLKKAGRTSELLLQRSWVLAQQIHNDFQLKKLLYYEEVDQLEELISLQQLKSYSMVIPNLHSIYLYNENLNRFYIVTEAKVQLVQSKPDFFDTAILNLLEDTAVINSGRPVTRYIPGDKEGVFTFLFHFLGKRAKIPMSTIIINISEAWLQAQIERAAINAYQETVVIDSNGNPIVGGKTTAFKELSSSGYISRVIEVTQKSGSNESTREGYFLYNDAHSKELITYYYRNDLGWIFIRRTPYKYIIGPVLTIRNVTFIVTSVFVLMTILISFLISKRIFIPIRQAAFYTEELERKEEENSAIINRELLHSFLMEPNHSAAESYFKNLEGLQFNIDLYQPVHCILFSLDPNISHSEELLSSRDNLSLKAELDLINENFGSKYSCETFPFKGGVLLTLINPPQEGGISAQELSEHTEEAIRLLAIEMNTSFSAAYNPTALTLSEAAASISDLEDAVKNRFIFGAGACIDLSEINRRKKCDCEVSKKEEYEIVTSIRNGQYTDAMKKCSVILYRSAEGTHRTIHTVYTRLISIIYKATEDIEKPSARQIPMSFSTALQDAAECINMGELQQLFAALLSAIEASFSKDTDTRNEQIVLAIQRIIKQRYNDCNLSSIMISEELGLSAPYIGRVFKEQTGQSLPNYINYYRIQKSKELLKTTDLSIQKILQETGYNNTSHFYSVFRKECGITPKAFRWEYSVGTAQVNSKISQN